MQCQRQTAQTDVQITHLIFFGNAVFFDVKRDAQTYAAFTAESCVNLRNEIVERRALIQIFDIESVETDDVQQTSERVGSEIDR